MHHSCSEEELFDKEFLPALYPRSSGSTSLPTPTAHDDPSRTPNSGKVAASPMLDMFSDPSFGGDYDISSYSFDVDGMAGLFAAVGGGE